MDCEQKKLKTALIKTAKAIKKKYQNLHNEQLAMNEKLEERYKPITSSLKSMLQTKFSDVDKDKSEIDHDDDKTSEIDSDSIDTPYNFLPKRLTYSDNTFPEEKRSSKDGESSVDRSKNEAINLSEYLDSLLTKDCDPQYGIRRVHGNLKIGNSIAQLDENQISVGSKTFKHSKGLLNLLFYKRPVDYTKSDLKTYKKILLLTNGHKKRFSFTSPIRTSKKSYKYNTIIKPLFHIGSGLQTEYMTVNSNPIDYSYWDDPNELVDRLRLLIASSSAGHTGHNNEIISIIEELREARIIE